MLRRLILAKVQCLAKRSRCAVRTEARTAVKMKIWPTIDFIGDCRPFYYASAMVHHLVPRRLITTRQLNAALRVRYLVCTFGG